MFAANQFVYSNAGILRLSELVPASTQLGSSFDVPIANINIQNLNSSTPLCRLRSGEGTCLRSIRIEAGESSLSTQAADRRCFRDNLRQLFRGRHVQKEDLQAQRWGGAAWNPLLTAFRRAIGRFGADDDPEVRDVVLSASGGIFTILRRAQLAGWLASDHGVNN